MSYVVMTGPWGGGGWHEVKWDFEYTGESMGEVGKLASNLYGEVSRLEEWAERLQRSLKEEGEDLLRAQQENRELKDTIEALRQTSRFEAVERYRQSLDAERKIVQNQKAEIIRLLNKLDEKGNDVAYLSAELVELENRHSKLRKGVEKVIERTSKHLAADSNDLRYAFGLVHRWLSRAMEDTDPPVTPVDGEGIACGNCMEAATPDA